MKLKLVEIGLFALFICILVNFASTILVFDNRYEKKADAADVQTVEDAASNEENVIGCVDCEKDTEVIEEVVEPVVEDGKAFYLSDYERRIAECIVMGESGSETYGGQVLVAQCLLNACLKDGLQPSEARIKYKYSGWKDNPTDSVKNAVSAVFDDGYKIVKEPILYFYAPKYCKGSWHETQDFVIELGGHRFFAEWIEWEAKAS